MAFSCRSDIANKASSFDESLLGQIDDVEINSGDSDNDDVLTETRNCTTHQIQIVDRSNKRTERVGIMDSKIKL